MANHRVTMYQDKDNEEQLHLNLDLIDEVRTDVEERTAKYKNLMARQHDAMVKPRRFNIGNLVLKKVSLATKNPAHGKLGPNWEGPYRIINCKRQELSTVEVCLYICSVFYSIILLLLWCDYGQGDGFACMYLLLNKD